MWFTIKIEKRFLFFKYFKRIKINCWTAKIIEVLNFLKCLENKEFNFWGWLIDFLDKHSKKKITNKEKGYIIKNFDGIFGLIKQTYFKGVFDGEIKKNNDYLPPLYSLAVFTAKEWNIDGYNLLYNMTYEDLKNYNEWIIWVLNEQTDKWKRKNRAIALSQKAKNRTEEEKQDIQKKLQVIRDFEEQKNKFKS